MALMHIFRDDPETCVVHFDHGTRKSSADDADFVRKTAEKYGLEFFSKRAELGENVSEEAARISRYEYFSQISEKVGGEIFTAHHGGDLVETIAINLVRGTGWRGLVPFGNKMVWRPFVETGLLPHEAAEELFTYSVSDLTGVNLNSDGDFSAESAGYFAERFIVSKKAIYKYAYVHDISFRQDPTNADDKYLRNRVREKLRFLPDYNIAELFKIYHQMNNLKLGVESMVDEILAKTDNDGGSGFETGAVKRYPREWFAEMDDEVALEILREILKRTQISATRPQMLDFLQAIRNYSSGKYFNLPDDKLVKITKSWFIL